MPHAPAAPVLKSVTGKDASLAVSATLGSDGNSPITEVVEYSLDGGAWRPSGGTSGTFTIKGLTNGTTYQCACGSGTPSGIAGVQRQVGDAEGGADAHADPTPTPTPRPRPPTQTTVLKVSAKTKSTVKVDRRSLLVRSVRTNGTVTAVRTACRWKGRPVTGAQGRRLCGIVTRGPGDAGPAELVRTNYRISARPSCSTGLSIRVRIGARNGDAKKATFTRTYRVARHPVIRCSLRGERLIRR